MNWLKPMLLMIVLGAILYGVYVVLNKGPAPEPPPGITKDWANPPDIKLGIVDDNSPGPAAPPGQQFGPASAAGPAPSFSTGPATPSGAQNPWPSNGPGQPSGMPATNAMASGPVTPPPVASPATTNGAALTGPAPGSPAGSNPMTSGANSAIAPPPGDAASASPAPSGFRPDGTPNSAPVAHGADVVAVAVANGMNAAPGSGFPAAQQPTESFSTAFATSKSQLSDGKLVEVLRAMTKWYDNPKLTAEESRQLSELLSQLAGTVVYSQQHLLEPAYIVLQGDRLETIAAQYNVPTELLAKINGVSDPNRLAPGTELKVLRGPFEAHVNLERREMSLTVEGCYAGRFTLIGVGDLARTDLAQKPDGVFTVASKRPDVYPNSNGAMPASGAGPLHHWVDLSSSPGGLGGPGSQPGSVGIVGTDDPVSVHPHGLNLSARDAEDVYDILSVGSRVVVRR